MVADAMEAVVGGPSPAMSPLLRGPGVVEVAWATTVVGKRPFHSVNEDLDHLRGGQLGHGICHHDLGGTVAELSPALLPFLQQALGPHSVIPSASG